MELSKTINDLIDEMQLTYRATIADRRDTLVLRVSRQNESMVLKLHSTGNADNSASKASLLVHEARLLATIPDLTNNLYLDHGLISGRHWLLIRDIDGIEIHAVAKKVRSTSVSRSDTQKQLLQLILKVAAFYNRLYSGGYLHADVQPAHTFLEGDEVTAIDWGLARPISEPNPLYKGGLAYYVSPKIAQQMKDGGVVEYAPADEVYSIGATIYMIYTGCLPIDFGVPKSELKSMPMELKLQRVIQNQVLSFEQVGAEPFPELEKVIARSLSSELSTRFRDPLVLYHRLIELG